MWRGGASPPVAPCTEIVVLLIVGIQILCIVDRWHTDPVTVALRTQLLMVSVSQ